MRVASSSGTTASAAYDYDVYGTVQRSVINVDTKYRFTGQEFDQMAAGSIYNFRARMYDSNLGMFYASDPAHSSSSPYGYVGGNPVSLVDPTGMVTAMAPGQPSMQEILMGIWYNDLSLEGYREGGWGGGFDAGDIASDPFGLFQGTGISVGNDGTIVVGSAILYGSKGPKDANGNPILGGIVNSGGGHFETFTLYQTSGHLEGQTGNPDSPGGYNPGHWVIDGYHTYTWQEWVQGNTNNSNYQVASLQAGNPIIDGIVDFVVHVIGEAIVEHPPLNEGEDEVLRRMNLEHKGEIPNYDAIFSLPAFPPNLISYPSSIDATGVSISPPLPPVSPPPPPTISTAGYRGSGR